MKLILVGWCHKFFLVVLHKISIQIRLIKSSGKIYNISSFHSSQQGASSGTTSVFCYKFSNFTREPCMQNTLEKNIELKTVHWSS